MAKDDVQLTAGVDASGVKEGMAQAAAHTEAGAAKMKKHVEGIGESLEHIGEQMSTAFKAAGLTLAFEALSKVSEKLHEMAENAIQIRNMSAVLQVTGIQFQAMGEAAEEAGIETGKLFQATEKLVQLLAEARAGSSAAIDKLFAMGVTLQQIQDPGFGTAEMLASLSGRLNNSATATSTMLALTKEFGGRAALAAQAIKALASDTGDWSEEAAKVNALTDYQTKRLQEVGLAWKDMGQWISNASAKLVVFAADSMAAYGQEQARDYYGNLPEQPKAISHHGGGSASKSGDADAAFAETKAQMDSIKDQIEAVKSGSAQKLALLKAYAAAALEFYGGKEVDAVKAADRAVIAETRQFHEEQERLRKENGTKAAAAAEKLFRLEQSVNTQRMAGVKAGLDESAKYLEEQLKLEEQAGELRQDIALENIASAEQELASLAAARLISRKQELEGLKDLENSKFAIQAQALQERMQLMAADVVAQAKARGQLELLELAHMRKLRAIDLQGMNELQRAWSSMFDSIGDAMTPVLSRFLNMTQSLKSTFAGMAVAIGDTMANMAARNIATMLAQAAAGKTIRMKEIAADAKAAAAAAYKAVVGIPYVGPFLAPAAAAVAFGGVMAFASAEGGYDIPANVNPMTQLHKGEMVLPKELADTVRGGVKGGRTGGGMTVNIQANDTRDFARALARNGGGAVGAALKGYARSRGNRVL